MMIRSDIFIFMRLEPDIPKLTHQNGIQPVHFGGKTFMHKTQALLNLESKYISLLKPYAPATPWDCPTHLSTLWRFCSPKKMSSASEHTSWKTTRPDTDNLVKTLKDCMAKAGFFKDDSLVCLDTIVKVLVPPEEEHGIVIRMHDLTEEDER